MPKNETSYWADDVNFDVVYIYNGETPTVTPLVLANQVDYATHGFPPATERAFQGGGIRILRPPHALRPGDILQPDHLSLQPDRVPPRHRLRHRQERERYRLPWRLRCALRVYGWHPGRAGPELAHR